MKLHISKWTSYMMQKVIGGEKRRKREGWSIGLSENQVERINSSERCIILHIDYKGHNTIF